MSREIKKIHPWANDIQCECIKFLWDCLGGNHHCYGKVEECNPKGIRYKGDDFHHLSTFDFDSLTYIVMEAHKRAIRVEISPNNFRTLSITFHKRTHDDTLLMWERHPTLKDIFEKYGQEQLT